MTKEEIKKELEKFNNFKFYPEDHHYECNGIKVGMSVTRFIEEFANPFDKFTIAEKVALKENKDVYDVIEEWDYKNRFACSKGSNGHDYAQSLWTGNLFEEDSFDGSDAFKMACEGIYSQARNFYEDFKDKFESIEAEQVVGSEEFDIASAIDHIFYNKLTGSAVLVDYKTNSLLKGYNDKSKYTKKMKMPLKKLEDDSLHHYYLQLSIYKYLVEKYTNIVFDEMFIVYMSENIDNYEIIEIPYLKDEVIKILEYRRVKNMNSVPILIYGKSGTGKSTSLRNFKEDEVGIINVLGKPLPFKNSLKSVSTDDYKSVLETIVKAKAKTIVIDDAGYLIVNQFMRNHSKGGGGNAVFSLYNDLADNFWNLISAIKQVPGGKRVYFLMHEDINEFGIVKPKTIGKLLDDKVCIEGMFTVAIRTVFEDGKYKFRLKTDGSDVTKTPFDMFTENEMENDLKILDDKIVEYYDLNKESEDK